MKYSFDFRDSEYGIEGSMTFTERSDEYAIDFVEVFCLEARNYLDIHYDEVCLINLDTGKEIEVYA